MVTEEYGRGTRVDMISDCAFAVRDQVHLWIIGEAYSGSIDSEILEMTKVVKEIIVEDQGYRRIVEPKAVLDVAFDTMQKSTRHGIGPVLLFPPKWRE